MADNFESCLSFVWRPGFDSPTDGFHVTSGDPGGGTNGGVIQETWDNSVRVGIVSGTLAEAGTDQLSAVLQATCWHPICPSVPAGIDLICFNGRMMSGWFSHILQQCLGMMGDDVDGWIGSKSLGRIMKADPATLIDAVCGSHYAYLSRLPTWGRFGRNWSRRLKAVQEQALAMTVVRRPT